MDEVNKGGRPRTTLTPEQIEEVEKLAAVLNQTQLCDFIGVRRVHFGKSCPGMKKFLPLIKRCAKL